jgi:hypothetical protein
MREWIELIGLILFTILLMGVIGYTRFANPDMTETRLFMTYWPIYTILMVGAVVFGVLFKFGHKK